MVCAVWFASLISREHQEELLALLEEKARRESFNAIRRYFPDTGPLRRELYPKHMEFFAWGLTRRVRLVIAANRVGKTETMGGYEVACHLTGVYPEWWPGRRYTRPVKVWASGDISTTTRDSIQEKMIGPWHERGTRLLPKDSIVNVSSKSGVPLGADTVTIRHSSGGTSTLMFKSFDQGRRAFQASEPDIVWLDEECPVDIYMESLTRTLTNNGMVILTFTPLQGVTELVQKFLEGGSVRRPINNDTKQVIFATWADAPHLDIKARADLLEEYLPWQRAARTEGIPQLGAGAIYPLEESRITVEDFPVPAHWQRAYGLDVGWNWTAFGFWAVDPDTGVAYMYECQKVSAMEPYEVVKLIHAVDGRIRGVIDPAAAGRGQKDGERLIQAYRDLGLDIVPANNAVAAGIQNVWRRLVSGKCKIFRGKGEPMLAEYRMYRRDEKGNIVKENDHLMDGGLRYPIMSFLVDGLAMTQKAQLMNDEDASMWLNVSKQERQQARSPLV
jgi:phage terminase large subunit-like protein